MEGGENKQPKSSNDETDSSEQARESSAASRFYECMFCRRGFTTAQALGGHMNIHRRDRARMRLNEAFSVSTKNDGEGSGSGASYDLNEDYRRLYPPVLSDPLKNYPVYFASSSSSSQEASLSADRSLQIRPSELTLFGGDQSHMLSQMHESTVKHREEEKKEDEDTEELDLELRLGHDP